MTGDRGGPLVGVRVVEFAALGPAPCVAMLLSDLGAEVLRIDRPGKGGNARDILNRGRASMEVDLKDPFAIDRLLGIIAAADVLVEGFRAGVMERLRLGPDRLLASQPRLVYTRVTGWGQDGPLASMAGHDINFIGIAGALAPLGEAGKPPPPPLNLVGDFGGGALFAALGIVAALLERERSGRGQVIDAAMVDGTSNLLAMYLSHMQGSRAGTGYAGRGYFLAGAAPYYRCYACADGKHVAVGCIEPRFWQEMLAALDVDERMSQDPAEWRKTSAILETVFATRSRDEWARVFAGTDACVTPVLEADELAGDAHLRHRGTYVSEYGLLQPAPAPRFSRTPGAIGGPPSMPGDGGAALAAKWLSDAGTGRTHPRGT